MVQAGITLGVYYTSLYIPVIKAGRMANHPHSGSQPPVSPVSPRSYPLSWMAAAVFHFPQPARFGARAQLLPSQMLYHIKLRVL